MKKRKISVVSAWHYVRRIYRSVLFVLLMIGYILYRVRYREELTSRLERMPGIFIVMWALFAVEMVFRFFPSKYESPGCQKQFKRNYVKSGNTEIEIPDNHATVFVALIWIVSNAVFGALHMIGLLDDGFMLLLCSAYSVCDMICILFFCPFQSWFLKNKCCTVCRIYNWDYAMMFTPLFFVQGVLSWSLLALSIALLFRWEITYYRHPERFSENTNEYLKCANCTEKLCLHKTQLRTLWKHIEEYTLDRVGRLKK